ncbi:unnamed protein product, partial [Closterium sp. Naga37s-1]
VGLIANATSVLRDLTHLADAMLGLTAVHSQAPFHLVAMFGPEHGFRGTAQRHSAGEALAAATLVESTCALSFLLHHPHPQPPFHLVAMFGPKHGFRGTAQHGFRGTAKRHGEGETLAAATLVESTCALSFLLHHPHPQPPLHLVAMFGPSTDSEARRSTGPDARCRESMGSDQMRGTAQVRELHCKVGGAWVGTLLEGCPAAAAHPPNLPFHLMAELGPETREHGFRSEARRRRESMGSDQRHGAGETVACYPGAQGLHVDWLVVALGGVESTCAPQTSLSPRGHVGARDERAWVQIRGTAQEGWRAPVRPKLPFHLVAMLGPETREHGFRSEARRRRESMGSDQRHGAGETVACYPGAQGLHVDWLVVALGGVESTCAPQTSLSPRGHVGARDERAWVQIRGTAQEGWRAPVRPKLPFHLVAMLGPETREHGFRSEARRRRESMGSDQRHGAGETVACYPGAQGLHVDWLVVALGGVESTCAPQTSLSPRGHVGARDERAWVQIRGTAQEGWRAPVRPKLPFHLVAMLGPETREHGFRSEARRRRESMGSDQRHGAGERVACYPGAQGLHVDWLVVALGGVESTCAPQTSLSPRGHVGARDERAWVQIRGTAQEGWRAPVRPKLPFHLAAMLGPETREHGFRSEARRRRESMGSDQRHGAGETVACYPGAQGLHVDWLVVALGGVESTCAPQTSLSPRGHVGARDERAWVQINGTAQLLPSEGWRAPVRPKLPFHLVAMLGPETREHGFRSEARRRRESMGSDQRHGAGERVACYPGAQGLHVDWLVVALGGVESTCAPQTSLSPRGHVGARDERAWVQIRGTAQEAWRAPVRPKLPFHLVAMLGPETREHGFRSEARRRRESMGSDQRHGAGETVACYPGAQGLHVDWLVVALGGVESTCAPQTSLSPRGHVGARDERAWVQIRGTAQVRELLATQEGWRAPVRPKLPFHLVAMLGPETREHGFRSEARRRRESMGSDQRHGAGETVACYPGAQGLHVDWLVVALGGVESTCAPQTSLSPRGHVGARDERAWVQIRGTAQVRELLATQEGWRAPVRPKLPFHLVAMLGPETREHGFRSEARRRRESMGSDQRHGAGETVACYPGAQGLHVDWLVVALGGVESTCAPQTSLSPRGHVGARDERAWVQIRGTAQVRELLATQEGWRAPVRPKLPFHLVAMLGPETREHGFRSEARRRRESMGSDQRHGAGETVACYPGAQGLHVDWLVVALGGVESTCAPQTSLSPRGHVGARDERAWVQIRGTAQEGWRAPVRPKLPFHLVAMLGPETREHGFRSEARRRRESMGSDQRHGAGETVACYPGAQGLHVDWLVVALGGVESTCAPQTSLSPRGHVGARDERAWVQIRGTAQVRQLLATQVRRDCMLTG